VGIGDMTFRIQGETKALFDDICTRHCVPFVGAGFSNNAIGKPVPRYKELSDLLAPYLPTSAKHELTKSDEIFEALARKYGDQWLSDRICEALEGATPGEVHQIFCSFGWPFIITTNYDLLLEEACRNIGQQVIVCSSEAELEDTTWPALEFPSPITTIIKVHGDCIRRGAMIVRPSFLNETQYEAQHPTFSAFLKQYLKDSSAIFLGYSLHDPHIRFLRQLLEVFSKVRGRIPRKDYIIQIDPTDRDFEKWEKENLIVVPVEAQEKGITKRRGMLEFLTALQGYWKEYRGCSLPEINFILSLPTATGSEEVDGVLDLDAPSSRLEKLRKDRIPFCAFFTHQSILKPWLSLLERIAGENNAAVLGISMEDLVGFATSTVSMILETLASGNLFFVVVDFTKHIEISKKLLKACQHLNIPYVVVSQNEQDIPVGFYPFDPLSYQLEDLSIPKSQLTSTLSVLMRQLSLRYPLEGCNALLDSEQYEAVIFQSFRVLEGALKFLVYRIAHAESVTFPESKIHQMLKFLAAHADEFHLMIDEVAIKKFTSIRNAAAHNADYRVSREKAERMLHFVERFIRQNIGPNLRGFDYG